MDNGINQALTNVMNMIRVGVIHSVDLEQSPPVCRVNLGNNLSDWLPMPNRRAGATRTWSPLSEGEEVLVIRPYGSTSDGYIVGSYNYDSFIAPSTDANTEKTVFSDGTSITYNSSENTLDISIAGAGVANVSCRAANVVASDSITFDCPDSEFTGNLVVQKKLTFNGGMEGHSGDSGVTATFEGNMQIIGDSLTHNGKNVGSSHHHIDGDGEETGDPF